MSLGKDSASHRGRGKMRDQWAVEGAEQVVGSSLQQGHQPGLSPQAATREPPRLLLYYLFLFYFN